MVLLKGEKSKDENYILLLRNYKRKNIVDGNISHIEKKKKTSSTKNAVSYTIILQKWKRRLPHTSNLCGNLLSNNLHLKNVKRRSSERRKIIHIRNSDLPWILLVNMYTGVATMEYSMELLQKAQNRTSFLLLTMFSN